MARRTKSARTSRSAPRRVSRRAKTSSRAGKRVSRSKSNKKGALARFGKKIERGLGMR